MLSANHGTSVRNVSEMSLVLGGSHAGSIALKDSINAGTYQATSSASCLIGRFSSS